MKAQWPNLQELYLSTNEIMKMTIQLARQATDTCVTESGKLGAIGNTDSDSDGASLIINIHLNLNYLRTMPFILNLHILSQELN